MPNPYVEVLRTPGGPGMSAAGLVARLPLSMAGIALLLLVADLTGSYAVAGVVNAGWILANAALAPPLARLVDRRGQRRVVGPQTVAHLAGVALVLVLAASHAHAGLLFIAAVAAGSLMPVIGSLVRSRWGFLLDRGPLLRTAYSWESVLDEVVFVIGPVLVTFLVVAMGPATGLAVTALVGAVGVAALLAQRRTEPPVLGGDAQQPGSALRNPGMPAVVAVSTLLGVTFAGVEVTVIATARSAGETAAAGVVLAVWAVSSVLAALAIGSVRQPIPPRRQLLVAALGLVIALIPLFFVEGLVGQGGVLLVAGLFVSPAMIASFALARDLVHVDQLTESLAWISVGISVGFALGSPLTGWLVDQVSPEAGFGAALAAMVLAVVWVAGSYPSLDAGSREAVSAGRR